MHDAKFLTIGRREFLALGPACALTSGLWPSQLAAAEPVQQAMPADLLTVGYWQGSAALAQLGGLRYETADYETADAAAAGDPAGDDAPERAELIAADALGRGDPRFARTGARVSLYGLYPHAGRPADDLASLSLAVSFAPFHDTLHQAWGFENGALPGARPGSAFTVPVDAATGLTFAFDIAEAGARRDAETVRVVTRFTLGPEPQTAKLRRGVYFVAWRGAGAKPLPSWRRYGVLSRDVAPEDGEGGDVRHFHVVQRRDERTPGDAAFLVLSVDYADDGDRV